MSVVVQTDKTAIVHAPSGTVLVAEVLGDVVGQTAWADITGKPPVMAVGDTQQDARDAIGLGTAAVADADDFATAAQGALADTALQEGDGLASLDSAASTKLAGIAAGATANDTDANLKDRANHTGTQPMESISDKQGKVLDDLTHLPSDTDLDTLFDLGGYMLDADELSPYQMGTVVFVYETEHPVYGAVIAQQCINLIQGAVYTRWHSTAAGGWQPVVYGVTEASVKNWYNATTADPPNAVINADGTFSRSTASHNPNPLLDVSGASHAFVKADVNKYARYTSTGAKTATFDSSEGFTAGDAFHITNRAASGNLTISGTGITFNAPKNGTLVLEPNDTVTVKFVSPNEADVMGSTGVV